MQDIISIITKDLSPNHKKQLIKSIEKNKITEITTAYLSAPNANVTNEEIKQFQPKSKSEILSRIINIENKTKYHNEDNQNEVKKLKNKL